MYVAQLRDTLHIREPPCLEREGTGSPFCLTSCVQRGSTSYNVLAAAALARDGSPLSEVSNKKPCFPSMMTRAALMSHAALRPGLRCGTGGRRIHRKMISSKLILVMLKLHLGESIKGLTTPSTTARRYHFLRLLAGNISGFLWCRVLLSR